jgi:hypothetical protein
MAIEFKDLSAEEQDRVRRALARYDKAAHAVQSGIAMWMSLDPSLFTPKHMRVGIDTGKAELWGLAQLLISKGVITLTEYHEAIADAMEEEKTRWEKEIGERLGREVSLK